ncbi:hypothetical protein ACFXKD_27730 [Nocardiopsis aegyptia]|uniref:hypothetical protein n=1 Tax=Nocardiopsis aegyptia TaxID=220378 RepID=UPI00366D8B28
MTQPRRFTLVRDVDVTGVSGTGTVADGVMWPDGTASVRWRGDHPSIVFWDRGWESVQHVHGHGGHTRVVWTDPDPAAYDDACPHCIDGHTPPTSGSQPWGAFVGPSRDGDGQPDQIIVMRSAGAHVSEADAHWAWQTLNGRTD